MSGQGHRVNHPHHHLHQQMHARRGNPTMMAHPGVPGYHEVMSRYSVNNTNLWEVIKQTMYDFQAYPAAGQTSLTYFQLPQGQGTGFNGGTKTIMDTNMQIGGQISAMQAFLVQDIQIIFEPTTPTVAAQMPAVFGAQALAAIINDVYIFRRVGALQFNIGSKNYLTEAPLWKFPSKQNFTVEGALADVSTTGASLQSRIAFASMKGPTYRLSPADLLLEANQAFNVNLIWDAAQAITNPARVGVVLDGLLYRASQ